jgi:hypothetical protein
MSRTNRALMITDSNQAYFAKMSVCGLQEVIPSLDFHGTGNDLTRGDISLHRPCARPASYMCTLEISSTDK